VSRIATTTGFQAPRIRQTAIRDESFGGVVYHIEGELVPSLTVELDRVPVYFEHHVMLWKQPAVQIGIMPLRGAIKRIMAGIQVIVTKAEGPGMIAFSRDGAGQIVPIHLAHGQSLDVREHQFLAATASLDYTYQRVRGFSNMLFGGNGFFIDTFRAGAGDGILWLHGYGNVFEKILAPGESIDVEPGAWVYKDPTVEMRTNVQNLSTGLLASMSFVTNRFTGPGRLGLQSMYLHMPTGT
jgi:uncharacterized protein (AIM24 family)